MTEHEHEDSGGWREYRRLILSELKRIDERVGSEAETHRNSIAETERVIMDKLSALDSRLSATREDVTILKVKAGVWGLMGGMIPALGVLFWTLVDKA